MLKRRPCPALLVFVEWMKIDNPSCTTVISEANNVCGPLHSSAVGERRLLALRRQAYPISTAGFAAKGAEGDMSKSLQIALM